MPSLAATACAVVRLSPVSMTMQTPSARRLASATGVVLLTGSATAMTPAGRPSTAMNKTVALSRRSASARDSRSALGTPPSLRSVALPTATARPSIVPVTPLPVTEANPLTSFSAMPRFLAEVMIAAASGCSLARSRLAPSASTVASSKPPAGTTATTRGFPSVKVPVLSATSVSIFSSRSSASASLISTPAVAPLPIPTMIDIGVASPSAQGQAMMTTETAATRAWA